MDSHAGPPYRLDYELNVDEATAFHRHMRRRVRLVSYLIAGAGLGIAALVWSTNPLVSLVLGGVAAIVVLLTAEPVVRWFIARRISQMPGTSTTVEIGEDGIVWRDTHGSGHVEWLRVKQVDSTAQVVVLRRGRLPLLWLPASAFGTPERQHEIVSYIRERVSAR